jgi:REP element-mobilizing transposase RayT
VNNQQGKKYCALTEYGKIAEREWFKTGELRKNITLDAFVIMPNHVHGIILINNVSDDKGTARRAPTRVQTNQPDLTDVFDHVPSNELLRDARRAPTIDQTNSHRPCHTSMFESFSRSRSNTIPTIVRAYKSAVTLQINKCRQLADEPIWQGNYYEHIIRNEETLSLTREYVINNLYNWENDKLFNSNT